MGPVADTAVADLRAAFSGRVLEPGDAGFDEARRVYNGMIDRHPALIARCTTTADVVDAVRHARAEGLDICVRGGGHNVAGRAAIDGALMIDLAEMKGIYVDRDAMTVRAQGGVLWRELNRAAAVHGLATTGGAVSTTGIAGFTLGGGLGWLMSKFGLACDNLTGVELVTADGRVLAVTDESDPELLWALRGGGGNFGVAVSLEYRLYPLATVVGGLIAHPFERAPEALRFYREAITGASDDLTVFCALVHAPDGSGTKLCAFIVCHTGAEADAQRDLAPFLEWGPPAVAEVGPMPYPALNMMLDENYPAGSLNYWLSSFTAGLTDGLFDAMVDRYASVPSQQTVILLEAFHGAVCRVAPTATAVPHREPGWNLLLPGTWMEPAETDANVGWVKETHAALGEHLTTRRWLNYLGDDQGDDAIRNAYGPNYDRLVAVKRRLDPENVFRHNHNIVP